MTRKNAYMVVTRWSISTFMMTSKNAYMVVTRWSITTSVPVAATAVRTGRGSVANLGDKPVAAPSQVEEADHLFNSLQSLTNYRVNNKLSKVFWRNASQKKWSNSTLVTQAGGQLPAVISNRRSPLVGVGASKNAAENREKQRTLLQIRSHPKLEFYVSSYVNSSREVLQVL